MGIGTNQHLLKLILVVKFDMATTTWLLIWFLLQEMTLKGDPHY